MPGRRRPGAKRLSRRETVRAATPHPQVLTNGAARGVSFPRRCRGFKAAALQSDTSRLVGASRPYHFSSEAVVSFRRMDDRASTFVIDEAGFFVVGMRLVVHTARSSGGVDVGQFAAQGAQAVAQTVFRVPLDRLQVPHDGA